MSPSVCSSMIIAIWVYLSIMLCRNKKRGRRGDKKKKGKDEATTWNRTQDFPVWEFLSLRFSQKGTKKVSKGEGEVLTCDQSLTKFVPKSDTGRFNLPSWK